MLAKRSWLYFGVLASALIPFVAFPPVQKATKVNYGILVSNPISDHPYETLKNPSFLSKYLSEASFTRPTLRSTFPSSAKYSNAKCEYVREHKTYSIFNCESRVIYSIYSRIVIIESEIRRVWPPRYDHSSGKLFLRFVSDKLESPSAAKPVNVLQDGDFVRAKAKIPIPIADYPVTLRLSKSAFLLQIFYLLAALLFIQRDFLKSSSIQSSGENPFSASHTRISFKAIRILLLQLSIVIFILEIFSRLVLPSPPLIANLYSRSRLIYAIQNLISKSLYDLQTAKSGKGSVLRDFAWAKTYSEFNLPLPIGGRRESYYGQSLTFKRPCGLLPICWSEINNKAIQIDKYGYQYSSTCLSREPSRIDILVVGGSVAEGAHASSSANTWWDHFAKKISDLKHDATCVGVLALGGAESDWELKAVRAHLSMYDTNIILSLGGLNDIVKRRTHEHQILLSSALGYLVNNTAMATVANSRSSLFVQVLQPALFDKKNLSKTEKLLLVGYLPKALYDPAAPGKVFSPYIDLMAHFSSRADWNNPNHFFIDQRTVFNEEKRTLYGDIWHFQDPAHQLLGETLATRLFQRLAAGHSTHIKLKPIN